MTRANATAARRLPQVVALARLDQLGNVQLLRVQLDEVHQLLRLVLRVQDGKLGVHSDVGVLAPQTAVQQAHELIEVTALLVLGNQLLSARAGETRDEDTAAPEKSAQ